MTNTTTHNDNATTWHQLKDQLTFCYRSAVNEAVKSAQGGGSSHGGATKPAPD